MSRDDTNIEEILSVFKDEAREHLQALGDSIVSLEHKPSKEDRETIFNIAFRAAHSIKGSASTLGLYVVETLTHGLEDLIGALKRDEVAESPDLFDILFDALDFIDAALALEDNEKIKNLTEEQKEFTKRLSQFLQDRQMEEKAGARKITKKTKPDSTKKVVAKKKVAVGQKSKESDGVENIDESLKDNLTNEKTADKKNIKAKFNTSIIKIPEQKLDNLIAQIGELFEVKIKIDEYFQLLTSNTMHIDKLMQNNLDMERKLNTFTSTQKGASGSSNEELREIIASNTETLNAINTQFTGINLDFSHEMQYIGKFINNIQDELKSIRMIPLSSLFSSFRRIVRDVSKEKKKLVRFDTEGGDYELDKKIVDAIREPLIHLIRNSIDHGIESSKERKQLGKNDVGTVKFSAKHKGNTMSIFIYDDGAGINANKIKQKLIKDSAVSEADFNRLSRDKILEFIFQPGFSTSESVDKISGRGVGLDVVKVALEKFNGKVSIHSQEGVGTTFELILPLTLATTNGLFIKTGGKVFVVPSLSIEKAVRFTYDDIIEMDGNIAIRYQDQPMALYYLADILKTPKFDKFSHSKATFIAIVLRVAEKTAAFIVDEVLGESDIVVRRLGDLLQKVDNISGITITGSGESIFILNPSDIFTSAATSDEARFVANTQMETIIDKTILVVDDSVTTRAFEKKVLELAGYRVMTASNGHEALDVLNDNHCDLVISDVQMPKIDGYQLTETLKKREKTKNLPVILITALDSDENKRKGVSAGADAYIVKSEFGQQELMDTINQLI